jgi:CheY-like chemotaxis protein
MRQSTIAERMRLRENERKRGLGYDSLRALENAGGGTVVALRRKAPQGQGALRLVPERDTPVILIADENEDVLAMLSLALGGEYDLLHARDGEQALSLALTESPDLVVLDARMPKLDGCRVTTQIRLNPATADTPVILLDTHPERIDVLRGFAAGASDYVTKPFGPAELLERIREALESGENVC